jgi:hypothetical protein
MIELMLLWPLGLKVYTLVKMTLVRVGIPYVRQPSDSD